MMYQSFNSSEDAAKIKGGSPRISLGESMGEGTPVFSEGVWTPKAITHERTQEVQNLLGSLLNPDKDPPISSQRVGWRNKKAQRKVNLPKIIFEAPEEEPSPESISKKFDRTPESGSGHNYPEIPDPQDPCSTEINKSENDWDVCEEKSDISPGGRNSGKIRRNHPTGKITNNIGRKDSIDMGVMNYIEKTLRTQRS
jgi:hypothetical protein